MLNQPYVLEIIVNEQHRDFRKEADAHRKVRQAKGDPTRRAVRSYQWLVCSGEHLVGRARKLAYEAPRFIAGAFPEGYRHKSAR